MNKYGLLLLICASVSLWGPIEYVQYLPAEGTAPNPCVEACKRIGNKHAVGKPGQTGQAALSHMDCACATSVSTIQLTAAQAEEAGGSCDAVCLRRNEKTIIQEPNDGGLLCVCAD